MGRGMASRGGLFIIRGSILGRWGRSYVLCKQLDTSIEAKQIFKSGASAISLDLMRFSLHTKLSRSTFCNCDCYHSVQYNHFAVLAW